MFLSWSLFDPRAAVARLERLPVDPKRDLNRGSVRQRICQVLRLPHEARWRNIWANFTEMADLIHPDL
jgi:hypothetical protein